VSARCAGVEHQARRVEADECATTVAWPSVSPKEATGALSSRMWDLLRIPGTPPDADKGGLIRRSPGGAAGDQRWIGPRRSGSAQLVLSSHTFSSRSAETVAGCRAGVADGDAPRISPFENDVRKATAHGSSARLGG